MLPHRSDAYMHQYASTMNSIIYSQTPYTNLALKFGGHMDLQIKFLMIVLLNELIRLRANLVYSILENLFFSNTVDLGQFVPPRFIRLGKLYILNTERYHKNKQL